MIFFQVWDFKLFQINEMIFTVTEGHGDNNITLFSRDSGPDSITVLCSVVS